MIEACEYCGSERVAAVLDKRIEKSHQAGNKYRQRCLYCSRWLLMCSTADFQTAEHQHVLPADADPEGDDPTLPAEEYGEFVRATDTRRATVKPTDEIAADDPATPAGLDDGRLVTDGGVDQVPETADEPETQPVNEFDCPSCGEPQTGFPDRCPHDECGVPYNWPENGQ